MILIDTTKPTQRIVFSSNFYDENGAFLLKITADSSKKSFQFSLTNNLSTDIERCFIYVMDTSLFSDLEVGFYTYSIVLNDLSVTSGKMYVKKIEEDNEHIIMPESPDDTEYIVYNGE